VTARAVQEPLTYHVASLLTEPLGSTRDYLVAGVTLDFGEELRQADPLEGTVHLARTNRGLVVSADLATSLQAECSRCLQEIEVPLELHIEEEALPTLDIKTGLPLDPRDEPDAVRINDHHELELETAVREAIFLAEPIAPLCGADCPGLCATCGERLASGTHIHDEAEIDPRLEVLKAFRVDGERETE
jgi:DUF177 domain-containing protein